MADPKELWTALSSAAKVGKHADALAAAEGLLEAVEADDAGGRALASAARLVALLELGRASEASAAEPSAATFEAAYAHYAAKDYARAATACDTAAAASEDLKPNLEHLSAQILYKTGRFDAAADAYDELVADGGAADDDDAAAELLANACAAFAAAGRGEAAQALYEAAGGDSVAAGTSANFELQFNLAAALLEGQGSQGRAADAVRRLKASEAAALVGLRAEGWTAAQIDTELASVRCQAAYAKHVAGDSAGAVATAKALLAAKPEDSASALAAAAVNLVAARDGKDLFDSTKKMKALTAAPDAAAALTARQREAAWKNRALLLAHMNKGAECRELLDALPEEAGAAGAAWPALVRATVSLREGDAAAALAVAEAAAEAAPGSVELSLAVAQLHVDGGRIAEAAAVLDGVEALRSAPAAVATLVGMYERIGRSDEALRVLDGAAAAAMSEDNGMEDEACVALLEAVGVARLQRADGAGAVAAYRALLVRTTGDDDVAADRARAALALAASFADPSAAEGHAASLPEAAEDGEISLEEAAEAVDADHLENLPLPRSARGSRAAAKEAVEAVGKEARASKSAARRLKVRAKLREAYLARKAAGDDPAFASYQSTGRLPTPDPERWLAKNQRSYGGRRKKKSGGKFSGAQGTGEGAARDMAKLDVFAKNEKKAADVQRKLDEAAAAREVEAARERAGLRTGKKGRKGKGRR